MISRDDRCLFETLDSIGRRDIVQHELGDLRRFASAIAALV
jgi:hypothetical protein